MKIALFHNLPSGGAKRTVYEQVKRLAQRHQIDLYSLTSADHEFADIRGFLQGTVILPFTPSRLFRSPLGRLNQGIRILDLMRLRRIMHSLANHINQKVYDIALVHPCQSAFTPSVLRYLRVPSLYYRHDVVRWIHDPPIIRSYNRRSCWHEKLDRVDPLRAAYCRLLIHEDRESMRAATRVVTNSYFTRESLYRVYGIAPFVCYHGVDTQRFQPHRKERGNFVLSVGMLTPAKGYGFLIESLGRIPQVRRPRLVLVSNLRLEEDARYLHRLAEQHRVVVEFKTMVDDQELVELYNQARCTLYAPVMESFGLVPLESMACGTPVVGIREGGVRETLVHGVTGLLADRDTDEFATAVVGLLDNPSLAEQMGRQARAHVEGRWGWEQAVEKLERHLRLVASDSDCSHSRPSHRSSPGA